MAESPGNPNGNPSPNTATPLRRARVACKTCNTRRVKCDAADGQPCWHCRMRQTPCELIESRRGKYIRKKHRLPQGQRISPGIQENNDTSSISKAGTSPCDTTNRPTPAGQSDRDEGPEQQFAGIARAQSSQLAQGGQIQPNACPNYFGDHSNSLSYIIEVVYHPKGGSAEPLKVHYPIPAFIADRPSANHEPRIEELMASLRDSFTMPCRDIADRLIRAFFEIIHPAYPVFDRKSFTRLYSQGRASPLVLQTIFLLGFTVGSETLVHDAGYTDRVTARRTHYLRAKALYDADYENDPTITTAVLLLLGFWWSGPDDQKDPCYWIGCAVTVAQSLGMHRSTSQYAMSQPVRSLRKRIWWSIYVRDRHTSASFGRPCRIRDEDCDIEALTEDDFNFDNDYDRSILPSQECFHISYAIEMSKLAVILGDILIGEFSPRPASPETFDTEALADKLAQWECELPDLLLRMPPDGTLGAPFWASMLHFSYQYCQILLFRPKAIENLSPAEAERDNRARMAADSITRIAEDLLAAGTINYGQIHLVPALFGALSIHTIVICRKDQIRRQLAENKSRQCMLALSQLAESWPVKIWISKAFVNLMRRLTGQGSNASGGSTISVSSSITSDRGSVASSGHWGLLGLQQQHITSPGRDSSRIIDGHHGIDRGGQDIQPTCMNDSQPRDLHAPDYFLQAADPFICDPFLAGYLDDTVDVDLILHNSLGQTLSVPSENINATGVPNPQGL